MTHFVENMIKGLDDDEIEFLDLVDRTKLAADRRKNIEEEQELNDYRNRVASLQEKALDEKLQATIAKPKVTTGTKPSQTKLLMGAVVKKNAPKKRKLSESGDAPPVNGVIDNKESEKKQLKVDNKTVEAKSEVGKNVGLTCIGILPGLGHYDDSSSDNSSDSETDTGPPKIDLLGRKIEKKQKEDN